MTTQLLIFDMDGTLIDTMEDYADKAAALIFEHYGKPRDEARRRYFDTSGLPFAQQLEQIFPKEPCTTGPISGGEIHAGGHPPVTP